MYRLILAAASAALVSVSIPLTASAQDDAPPYPPMPMAPASVNWSLIQREQWMEDRIQNSAARGWLSGNEIGRGQSEMRSIRSEHLRLKARDGGALSPADRLYIAQRINELNATLQWQGDNPTPPWR